MVKFCPTIVYFSLDDSLYYFLKIMPYKPNMKAYKGVGKNKGV